MFGTVVFLAALTQVPEDKKTLGQLTERFLAACARRETDKALAFWDEKSPQRGALRNKDLAAFSRRDRLEIHGITFDGWQFPDAERAEVRLRFDLRWTDRESGRAERDRIVWKTRFVRTPDGWKIWQRFYVVVEDLLRAGRDGWEAVLKREKENISPNVVATLCDEGVQYWLEGKRELGDIFLEAAFAAAKFTRENPHLALCLHNRGLVRAAGGRHEEAIADQTEAVKLYAMAKRPHDEARALAAIHESYWNQSDFARAMAAAEQFLAAARRAGSPRLEALALRNAANVYWAAGKLDEALDTVSAALKIVREKVRDERFEASLQHNLGAVLQTQGKFDEALKTYEIMRAFSRKSGLVADEAMALMNTGVIHFERNQNRQALDSLLEARRLAGQVKDSLTEANILVNLGSVQLRLEQLPEGRDTLRQARSQAEKIGARVTLFHAYWGLGQAELMLNRLDKSAEAFEKAIALIEEVRARVREPALKTSFFAQYQTPYVKLAGCRLLQKRATEAFKISEQARGRTLTDLLEGSGVSIGRVLSAEERRREQLASERLALAEGKHRRVGTREGSDAEKQNLAVVLAARRELEQVRLQLYLAHPELRDQRAHYRPATLAELEKGLFAGDPGLGLVSYLVGSDLVMAFVIKPAPDGKGLQVLARPLSIPSAKLEAKVEEFRSLCGDPARDPRKAGGELYELLVKPIEEHLRGRTHLAILPDGPLHLLPFQALVDGNGRYLIESYSLSYAPSATALLKMAELAARRREDRTPVRAAVLGRPEMPAALMNRLGDLKHTEEEALAVAQALGTKPRLGKEASKTQAREELANASHIHIACHGVLNEASPMYSYLALAGANEDSSTLYAHELMAMELKAKLVVLSACRTAEGKIVSGEGLLGMAWALFVARTPSCVLTQWSVSDRSTAELMERFYKELASGKVSKAEALRQAQLGLLRQEKYKHPDHWAAYVLMGDWGR